MIPPDPVRTLARLEWPTALACSSNIMTRKPPLPGKVHLFRHNLLRTGSTLDRRC